MSEPFADDVLLPGYRSVGRPAERMVPLPKGKLAFPPATRRDISREQKANNYSFLALETPSHLHLMT